MSWTASRGRITFISTLVLLAIVGLALFITSPWHQHSRLTTQPCAFTSFEHASSTGESALPTLIMPVLEAIDLWTGCETRLSEPILGHPAPVRAPPSSPAFA